MNVAIDDQQGGSLSVWRDGSMCVTRSTKDRSTMAMASSDKTSALTKEILTKRLGCGLESAKNTFKVTT